MLVHAENAFSVPSTSFAISASNEQYVLNYSVDGTNWTAYSDATPSGETAIVNFGAKGLMYKLVGNNSDVYIQY